MSFFNNWVQGIVIAVIITVIIEMLLPEGNSKKYIKIVLGIYVVFSIIAPVIGNITGGRFEVSSIVISLILSYKYSLVFLSSFL